MTTTTTKTVTVNGRVVYPTVYRSETLARAASRWVMLGDAGEYWVCRPVDCERLHRAGYEYLSRAE